MLYLAFALSVLLRAWRQRTNLIVFVVATAIVGYMTQAFFTISVVSVAYLFWILLGVLDGQVRKNGGDGSKNEGDGSFC